MRAIDQLVLGRVLWPKDGVDLLAPGGAVFEDTVFTARVGTVVDVSEVDGFIDEKMTALIESHPADGSLGKAIRRLEEDSVYCAVPPFSRLVLRSRCKLCRDEALYTVECLRRDAFAAGAAAAGEPSCELEPSEAEWLITGTLLLSSPKAMASPFAVCLFTCKADAEGNLLERPTAGPVAGLVSRLFGVKALFELNADHANRVEHALHVFATAFTFLSCKNVRIRRVEEPPKLVRKFELKHRWPRHSYHVLDIQPMRAVLAQADPTNAMTLARAMHVCRGHLKDYRERGLFGKAKGVYYWSPHLRGEAVAGTVAKDYRLRPPAEPAP